MFQGCFNPRFEEVMKRVLFEYQEDKFESDTSPFNQDEFIVYNSEAVESD